MKIKAESYIVFSQGQGEESTDSFTFRVVKDFDQEEVSKAYRAEFVSSDKRREPDAHEFVHWMERHGYIDELEVHEWHIGSGRFDPEIETPRGSAFLRSGGKGATDSS